MGRLVSKFWIIWSEREREKNDYFPLASLKVKRSHGSGRVTKLALGEGKRRISKCPLLSSCKRAWPRDQDRPPKQKRVEIPVDISKVYNEYKDRKQVGKFKNFFCRKKIVFYIYRENLM